LRNKLLDRLSYIRGEGSLDPCLLPLCLSLAFLSEISLNTLILSLHFANLPPSSLMADPETQPSSSYTNEYTPLLPSDRRHISSLYQTRDFIASHIGNVHGEDSWVWSLRRGLQHFLTSKWGHYIVILLVSADISCIFADFLVSLHICEHCGEVNFDCKSWERANEALETVSLVFSCLFMAELVASIFAFGFRCDSPVKLYTRRTHLHAATFVPNSTSSTPSSSSLLSSLTSSCTDPLRKLARLSWCSACGVCLKSLKSSLRERKTSWSRCKRKSTSWNVKRRVSPRRINS